MILYRRRNLPVLRLVEVAGGRQLSAGRNLTSFDISCGMGD
jgi:hypothetical protein